MPRDPERLFELIRRRERVAQLFVEGATHAQIAQKLGVSLGTVRRDLRRVARLWRKILERDFSTAKSHELAKINRLEAAAWEAWQRSHKDEETTKVTVEGEKRRAEKVTSNQAGDAKFLDKVAWCIDKRCEILSLTGPADANSGEHADDISTEQRRKRVLTLLGLFRERERADAAGPGTVDAAVDRPDAADTPADVG